MTESYRLENDNEERFLRAAELGKMFGCSRAKAYALMASGQVPVIRFGRSIRSPRTALMAWIKNNTVRP